MKLLEIDDDGLISVEICPNGVSGVSYVPAPMMTEIERAKRVQKAIEGFYIHGYFVLSQKRIRNPIFDKRDEKSTTEIAWRTCQTEDEAKFVARKVNDMILMQNT